MPAGPNFRIFRIFRYQTEERTELRTAPQPDLFRRRPRRPPPPLERRFHIALADLLRIGIAPGWWASHLPAGEFRTPATARLLARLGVCRGLPDFLILGPDGVHFLELKRKGAKPTPDQADFMVRCRKAGIPCAVVDSFDQAVEQLRIWGALSDRVRPQ